MIVTDGNKLYNTANMIMIDNKISNQYDKWSRSTEQILMNNDGEYFYFFRNGYGLVSFGKTNYNSIKETENAEFHDIICRHDYYINDLLCGFDWFERVLSYKDVLQLSNIDDEKIVELANQYDAKRSTDSDEFKCEAMNINDDARIEDTYLQGVEMTYTMLNDNTQTLFSAIDVQNHSELTVIKGNSGYWITHQENMGESLTIALSKEIPILLIMAYQAKEQHFELEEIDISEIDQEFLDPSMSTYTIKQPNTNELSKIWGVTRQNMSTTYNNPKETVARIRLRQKKIIELGAMCLKYNIDEEELLQIIKKKYSAG
jgi:hypothetical protein